MKWMAKFLLQESGDIHGAAARQLYDFERQHGKSWIVGLSETISTAFVLLLLNRVNAVRMLHGRRLGLPLSQPKLHQLDF
jgi:hypothetical protein